MLTLRPIQESDLEAIALIQAHSWRDSYRGILGDAYLDDEVFAERLAHWRAAWDRPAPGQVGLLALELGTPLGFINGEGDSDPRWGTLLDHLHVLPGRRGQGIGTRLVHALAETALARWPGIPVHLWCFERNLRSRGYYERLGGALVERREIPAADGTLVAACRYAWQEPGVLLECSRISAASAAPEATADTRPSRP